MVDIRSTGPIILTGPAPTPAATNTNHPWGPLDLPDFPVQGVPLVRQWTWVPRRPRPGRHHLVVVK